VTVDALNCQRAIAAGQIIDQGGDYAFALQGQSGHAPHDGVGTFLG